jgi:hypothetical protein
MELAPDLTAKIECPWGPDLNVKREWCYLCPYEHENKCCFPKVQDSMRGQPSKNMQDIWARNVQQEKNRVEGERLKEKQAAWKRKQIIAHEAEETLGKTDLF